MLIWEACAAAIGRFSTKECCQNCEFHRFQGYRNPRGPAPAGFLESCRGEPGTWQLGLNWLVYYFPIIYTCCSTKIYQSIETSEQKQSRHKTSGGPVPVHGRTGSDRVRVPIKKYFKLLYFEFASTRIARVAQSSTTIWVLYKYYGHWKF